MAPLPDYLVHKMAVNGQLWSTHNIHLSEGKLARMLSINPMDVCWDYNIVANKYDVDALLWDCASLLYLLIKSFF